MMRFLREGDEEKLRNFYAERGMTVPNLNPLATIVVENSDGSKFLAVITDDLVHRVSLWSDETQEGHLAVFKALHLVENVLRANRVRCYDVNIETEAALMRDVAERLDFKATGEMRYERTLDDVFTRR